MHWERLTPGEIAGLDAAMTDGIAAALLRASGLLIMKTGATGDGGWICAYPPSGLSFVAAKEWARRHGLCFSRDDLYLTRGEVERAGADMGVITSAREIASYVADADEPTNELLATFRRPQDAPLPSPVFRAQASVWQATSAVHTHSSNRASEARASRAWMKAFQAGFNKTADPVQSDDAVFIQLLQIADRRQAE